MTDEAELQLQQDDELLRIVRDHVKAHIDVYPFVLQMLNTVLRAAQECPSLGGPESTLLDGIHKEIRRELIKWDRHSAPFMDKSIYESPR